MTRRFRTITSKTTQLAGCKQYIFVSTYVKLMNDGEADTLAISKHLGVGRPRVSQRKGTFETVFSSLKQNPCKALAQQVAK